MTSVNWTAERVEWVVEVVGDEVRALFTAPESGAVVGVKLDVEQATDLARALLRGCSAVVHEGWTDLHRDS